MRNVLHRICLTVWRKKSTVLVAVALVSVIIFALFYVISERSKNVNKGDLSNGEMEALVQDKSDVKFVKGKGDGSSLSKLGIDLDAEALSKLDPASRDQVVALKLEEEKIIKEIEEQLGIPFVNLDLKHPYIPKQRIVHFDLKGAPPKVAFFKRLFPIIKTLGATGILLEYEDMFPFEGNLKSIRAKNAYTIEEIKEIINLAETSKLDIIPLVQTFGHVEFALKHKEWSKLREVPGSPQALCPSRNASLEFISDIVNQVMALHPKSSFLHIGCDEVFQMGECEQCRLELHETLFLRHIKNVANLIHEKWPKLKLIIWDDMLRHLNQQTMVDMGLGNYVEPMVWVYAEDIYRFVGLPIWEKYAAIFKTAWTASAYKGAFGETLIVPDARRHLENNLRWLDVMSQQNKNFKMQFRGIALTGWQRYDHFAVLCELLPASIPSLALSLLAVSNGFFNLSLKSTLLGALSCPTHTTSKNSPFITLDSDPNLWDRLGRCMFPGSPFFRLTYRMHSTEIEVMEYLRMTKRHKGWLTEYNVRHNYSLPLRVDELTSDLPRIYHGLISLARTAADCMNEVFDEFTIAEWIEQKIYPFVIELERIQNQSSILKTVDNWPSRPLVPLKDLQRLGVGVPP